MYTQKTAKCIGLKSICSLLNSGNLQRYICAIQDQDTLKSIDEGNVEVIFQTWEFGFQYAYTTCKRSHSSAGMCYEYNRKSAVHSGHIPKIEYARQMFFDISSAFFANKDSFNILSLYLLHLI